jgi:pimeloyl-ACP methyl ester carboxylesterase
MTLVQLWFGAAGRLAPRMAERQAAALFFTPRQRRPTHPPAEWTRMSVDDRLSVWAAGRGPTVLLQHGWEGSAADMIPVGAGLAREGYRAVLVDMPAHGQSAGRSTTVVEWLELLQVTDHALGGIDAIVGHSLGAMASALAVAESRVDARAAVLFAPMSTPEQVIGPYAQTIGLPAARTNGLRVQMERRTGRDIASLDVCQAVRDLEVPSLILHDPRDRIADWSYAKAIAEAWPRSRLIACDGLGHRRLLSDALNVARVVEFIRTAIAAPAPQSH